MPTQAPVDFPHLYTVLDAALKGKFQRQGRKLNPARTMGLLCVMCTLGQKGYRRVIREMRTGLRRAFGWVLDEDVPSPQAFGQARQAMTLDICREAFDAVQQACPLSNRASARGYGGFREVGIDGTRLPLPVDRRLVDHFGCPSNQEGPTAAPMAGLVQLWDLAANRPIAFSLTRCDFSERAEALDLFRNLGETDLLVGDRGYPSFEIFAALLQRNIRFVLRCSLRLNTVVRDFLASAETDTEVEIAAPKKYQHQGSIRLRLVKVVLPSGTTEILATNLWASENHAIADLSALYARRWRVETAFKEMKVWHAVEAFSARFPEGIEQELMALQIFLLLASELEAHAQEDLQRRRAEADSDEERERLAAVRFNRLLIADTAVDLTRVAVDDLAAIPAMLASNLHYIWKQRTKTRPGRAYPRIRKAAAKGFKARGA